jgi:phosphatidylglycerophosphatase A
LAAIEPAKPPRSRKSSFRRLLDRFKPVEEPPPGPPLLGAKATAVKVLGSFFGTGFLPLAPGTWGSLAALAIWLVGRNLAAGAGMRPGLVDAGCILLSIFFALATLGLGGAAERAAAARDPRWFVLDELAGAFLALYGLAAYNLPFAAAAAFLLFRLLDVTKLGAIGWAQRGVKGGVGILLDDLFAGALANLIVRAAAWVLVRWAGQG